VTDLTLSLNALTFEELVDSGRSMIPTLAPLWTDHNIHDPGIMLMELMAWIAEAQMYSMDRLRRDERAAYANLLGVEPRGPLPARGLVWPFVDSVSWPEGFVVKQGSGISADRPTVPSFFAAYDVQLTIAKLTRVETRFADGTSHDWTLVNEEQSATFMPFGDSAQSGARLVLTFQRTAPASQTAAAPLSLGWQIVSDSPALAAQTLMRSNLNVMLSDADGDRRIEGIADTTGGLLQSGVLLLSPGRITPENGKFRLTLRSSTGGFPRAPRVARIGINVLPVEQVEQIQDPSGSLGLAMPNQQYTLAEDGFVFTGIGANDLQIATQEKGQTFPWTFTADLQNSGPADRHFELDPALGVVTFGNGVNGMRVPKDAPIQAQYQISAGSGGNVQTGMNWSVGGVAEMFGTNPEPTKGGLDATTLDDLRDEARIDADENRPLVTSSDIEEAAISYTDLDVTRAVEMPYDPNQPPGSRLLVVAGPHDPGASGPDLAESPEFLRAVHRRIAPRLPLGQRLRVEGPKYVPVKITATLTAARNTDPAVVQTGVLDALQQRVAIVTPDGLGEWPLGRAVTLRSVQGWLRKVPGVALVVSVNVSAGTFGPSALPDLQISAADITVNRPAAGSMQ
jgi:hypothetical protein